MCLLLCGHAGADDALQLIQHRFGRESGSIDADRVGGGSQRIGDARLVPFVSFADLTQDVVEWGRLLVTLMQFTLAASGSLFGVGGDVELALGVWKDSGPLIAAFGHDVATAREVTLTSSQFATYRRVRRNDRTAVRNFRRSHVIRHVTTIDEDVLLIELQLHRMSALGNRGRVVQVDRTLQTLPRDGAVHRPGVEKIKLQPPRKPASGRALP